MSETKLVGLERCIGPLMFITDTDRRPFVRLGGIKSSEELSAPQMIGGQAVRGFVVVAETRSSVLPPLATIETGLAALPSLDSTALRRGLCIRCQPYKRACTSSLYNYSFQNRSWKSLFSTPSKFFFRQEHANGTVRVSRVFVRKPKGCR